MVSQTNLILHVSVKNLMFNQLINFSNKYLKTALPFSFHIPSAAYECLDLQVNYEIRIMFLILIKIFISEIIICNYSSRPENISSPD